MSELLCHLYVDGRRIPSTSFSFKVTTPSAEKRRRLAVAIEFTMDGAYAASLGLKTGKARLEFSPEVVVDVFARHEAQDGGARYRLLGTVEGTWSPGQRPEDRKIRLGG